MGNIVAKKHLGQNFLRNHDILKKIVGNDDFSQKNIVEVGPGPGDLTSEILGRHPISLSLIELDHDMIPLILSRFSTANNIDLYWSDVLKVNITQGERGNDSGNIQLYEQKTHITLPSYELYGNIPYYITSPIIHHFLYDVSLQPQIAVFTMQKEVADRILARDGKHSVLSLSCQLMTDIEKVCDINPNNFFPVPKVGSTCLRFIFKKNISQKKSWETLKIIQKGFSQKRKKLISNLENNGYSRERLREIFTKINIEENARAEDLHISDWSQLHTYLNI